MTDRTRWNSATIVFCVIAAIFAAARAYPLVDDVPLRAGDDWTSYKIHALDILENGLSMPGVTTVYDLPGGFLYNYFVAGVFAVLGPNSTFVYILQAVMMAFAVMVYLAMARYCLSALASGLFAAAVALMWYRNAIHLVFRLLSENLAYPLIALSTLALLSARERDSLRWYGLAGMLLGLVVLTRLNLIIIPFAAALLVLIYAGSGIRRRVLSATVLMATAVALISLLPLRNYFAAGQFALVARAHVNLLPTLDRSAFVAFGKRALYCLGVLVDGMHWRSPGAWNLNKYLFVASSGALAFLIVAGYRRRLELIDALALAWLAAAYIPFIVLPMLGGYGMRFQWPTAPFVVFLAFRFALLIPEWIKRLGNRDARAA